MRCNVESKTISMDFSYSVSLKSTGLSCTLNGSITHTFFCNIIIGYLENVGLLSYAGLWNVNTFHYTITNAHLLLSSLISSVKFLRFWEAFKPIQFNSTQYNFKPKTNFPKFWFSLGSLNFICNDEYCFSWSDRLTFYFWGNVCQVSNPE